MKKFDIGSKICFLIDYDDNDLTMGWIYGIASKDDKEIIYNLVEDKNELSKPDSKKLFRRRDFLIRKFEKNLNKKYHVINEFLKRKWISKNIQANREKLIFLEKGNSKTKILLKAILNQIKSIIKFIWEIFIIGTVRLLFGDIMDYYPNIINLNKKKIELLNKKQEFEIYRVMLPNVGSLYAEKQKEIDKIASEIKEIEKHNIDISRSLIAMLIAVLSLIIAIKSMNP